MATTFTCDFCGEQIIDERLMVSLEGRGNMYNPDGLWGDPGARRSWVSGTIGHYHATEDRHCWAEMLDRIGLIHDVSPKLIERSEGAVRRQAEREERERERVERRRRRELWQTASWDARAEMLLQALGEDRLIGSEIADRIMAEVDVELRATDVRSLAMRMLAAGQLDREPEMFRGKLRYRWSLSRRLSGPIADLERAYGESEEGVA